MSLQLNAFECGWRVEKRGTALFMGKTGGKCDVTGQIVYLAGRFRVDINVQPLEDWHRGRSPA